MRIAERWGRDRAVVTLAALLIADPVFTGAPKSWLLRKNWTP